MVLTVPFDRLAAEVKARCANAAVYLTRHAGMTLATVGAEQVIVQAETDAPLDSVRERLETAGLQVAEGRWMVDEEAHEADTHRPVHLAAVGYRSSDGGVGVWVDAYHRSPIVGEVLDRFFDEMREEGHTGNVTQEEFERIAGPTVVVVGPDQLQEFADKSERD